jgi:hypothetical protein
MVGFPSLWESRRPIHNHRRPAVILQLVSNPTSPTTTTSHTMTLSVALPSFDAFLRSARRAPAVLPRAAPMSFRTPTIRSSNNGYDSPVATTSASSSSSAMTPPGSPFYGHFVSLSPESSPVSDCHDTINPWHLAASDSETDERVSYNVTRYQDLLTQQCVAIAPRPRNSPLTSATAATAPKLMRVKKKYLKEKQRCEIVRRVRAGEKQAHLAKEYGVSRAAVCYLLKHEFDILRRSALRQQRRKHAKGQ